MKQEIRDGVLIITHDTGIVDVYGRAKVEALRDIRLLEIQAIQTDVNKLNADIQTMKATEYPSVAKRILRRLHLT